MWKLSLNIWLLTLISLSLFLTFNESHKSHFSLSLQKIGKLFDPFHPFFEVESGHSRSQAKESFKSWRKWIGWSLFFISNVSWQTLSRSFPGREIEDFLSIVFFISSAVNWIDIVISEWTSFIKKKLFQSKKTLSIKFFIRVTCMRASIIISSLNVSRCRPIKSKIFRWGMLWHARHTLIKHGRNINLINMLEWNIYVILCKTCFN